MARSGRRWNADRHQLPPRHRLKDLDEKAIEREIADNRRVGRATSLPDAHSSFCYPNGKSTGWNHIPASRVVSATTARLNDASVPLFAIRRILDDERKSQLVEAEWPNFPHSAQVLGALRRGDRGAMMGCATSGAAT
jgi:hypothetical protein